MEATVDGGAQVQQVVNIECVQEFVEAPVLNIQFRYGHTLISVVRASDPHILFS